MDAVAGAIPVRLTFNTREDSAPVWTPDGRRIVFQSLIRDEVNLRNTYHIHLMNADGSSLVQLTQGAFSNLRPDVSPDGTRIAFASNRGQNGEIYIMDFNGTNVRQLTTQGGDFPKWSSDGTRIAFNRNNQLWVMNADGSGQRLVSGQLNVGRFSWRPDGQYIAYEASIPNVGTAIYLMTADASVILPLTSPGTGEHDTNPAWSPDGETIAFQRYRSGDSEIWLITPRSGQYQRITYHPANDIEPSWAP